MSEFQQYVRQAPKPWTRYTIPGIYPVLPRMNYGVDYLNRLIMMPPTKPWARDTKKPSKFEWARRYRRSRTKSYI